MTNPTTPTTANPTPNPTGTSSAGGHLRRRIGVPVGVAVTVAVTTALFAGGCGTTTEIPNAVDLAEALVGPDTFPSDDGAWTINVPPDQPDSSSGVVTDEMQGLLPRLDLCPEASEASRNAVDTVQWMAFRQLDLDVADPVDPPDDRQGHMVFVQEYLLAADPDEVTETFDLLRDGMQACLGEIPADDEGGGTAEEMPLPDLGDDRYGVLMLLDEGGGWAEWRLHQALVRDGAVLALVSVVDIRADTEPLYTVDEVGDLMATAIDEL